MDSRINDPALSPQQRLDALAAQLAGGLELPDFVGESNNHIHTCYSFSPYTPAAAALHARQAGLQVAGSVDHDSATGAAELAAAAGQLGMGAVTGFECRVYVYSADEVACGEAPLHERKFNNPDTPGIAYMTVQGIAASQRERVAHFLAPIRQARLARTTEMAARANAVLARLDAQRIDVAADIVAQSQFHQGGTVTERHLLAAMATKLVDRFGRGQALVNGLAELGMSLSDAMAAQLADEDNEHLIFDLLGVMKAEFLGEIYVVPSRAECPTMAEVIEFALSIAAVPCYAYLGDVTASPTGDKKAEKFEDDFLEELFALLHRVGMPAITYMPPRNTPEQMARIARLAAEYGLLEVSGVDINTPRQSFNCPELQRRELAHLNVATWALVAHELLAEQSLELGLFGPLAAKLPLTDRVARYEVIGRAIVQQGADVVTLAKQLREELT